MQTLSGSCHCGKITFEIEGTPDKLYECNCSHCTRKGYLMWFIPRGQLRLKTPASAMSTYRFHKRVIDHHFCPDCGCAPFGFGKDRQNQPTAAVNARCLEDFDFSSIERVHVDGRSF
ncbi:MAG TPA: GFA family protein [Solimonas sp.]